MKRLTMSTLVLVLMTITMHAAFKHPGIYSSKEQLDFIKQKIKKGEEPWKSAYDKLLKSNPTSRKPKPYVKVPGSSKPSERKEMDNMTLDGSHAFASALLFYFTGEKKYADYSIKVLNAWNIFQKAPMALYSTWAVPHFVNAAELMKHTPGSGWKQGDIKKFDKMVDKYMWPRVQPPATKTGSNHGCTANEAQFAIAIYLDDQKKFDEAIENYNWLIHRWIFYKKPGRLNGETANTCRDLSHTRLTIGILHAAQYAWNQGVDLWKPHKQRYAAFAELHAGIMTGDRKVPANICAWKKGQKGKVFCKGNVFGNDPSKGGFPPCQETAWEILYNHISRRLGVSLPLTIKMTKRQRPFGKISHRADKWETLIHANINPDDIGVITPTAPSVKIISPTDNALFAPLSEITLSADATDDGKIQKVELRVNGVVLATEKKAPYTTTWKPSEPGTYSIDAVAYDNDKLSTVSGSITVYIDEDPQAPISIESVDAEQAPNYAKNLFDGLTDNDHRWSAQGYPKSVVIDYGESKNIIGANVFTYNNRSYHFTIGISESPDGNFIEVVNQTGVTSSQPIEHTFEATKGRYVKLTVTGATSYSNDWISINEFEITEAATTPVNYSRTPTDDIYTQGGTLHNTSELRVENASRRRVTYMKFDLSEVDGSVSNASLTLKETSGEAGNGTFKVYLGENANWNETNAGNLPAKAAEVGSYTGNIAKNQKFSIDLKGIPVGESITLIVDMNTGGNDISFISSEGATPPELSFTSLKSTIQALTLTNKFENSRIYPNPAKEYINIDLTESKVSNALIEISDISGRVVKKDKLANGLAQLNIANLQNGLYLIRITNGKEFMSARFVKK